MSKRRSTPALFEVIRGPGAEASGRVAAPPPPEHVEPAPGPAVPAIGGRILRVPMGYLFVAGGVLVIVLLVAYSIGYQRGRAAVEEMDAFGGGTGDELPIVDPTLPDPSNTTATPGVGGEESRRPATEERREPPRSTPRNSAQRQPGMYDDTRQAGLNYIIVTRLAREEAEEVAQFLQQNGVDAMLIADNNAWLVIARQGFESFYSNPEAQRLRERLITLGREWKRQHGGSRDFSDLYGRKYTG
ncbi:MAG: hypothetical protein ACF8PN_00655 [Phycisphaerales bacterium]